MTPAMSFCFRRSADFRIVASGVFALTATGADDCCWLPQPTAAAAKNATSATRTRRVDMIVTLRTRERGRTLAGGLLGSYRRAAGAPKTAQKRNSEGGPSEFNPAVAGGGTYASFFSGGCSVGLGALMGLVTESVRIHDT